MPPPWEFASGARAQAHAWARAWPSVCADMCVGIRAWRDGASGEVGPRAGRFAITNMVSWLICCND